MIESNVLLREFISVIQKRVSHKATLANTIADLLDMDKDAVYRRLRGDVNFSFFEMAVIARTLGISLDNIAGLDTEQCKSIKLALTKHIEPTDVDYAMFEDYINTMKFIKDEPDSKIMEGGYLFPNYLFFDYEYITRFIMFRWSQSSYFGKRLPFHEITIPKRMRDLQKEACYYARRIKSTTYIWDNRIFELFVSNVKFYAKIRLIKEEDVVLIKNDLNTLLNDIKKIAVAGKYPDTKNEVSIYTGDINANANFGFIEAKNIRISLVRAFLLNSFSSLDSLLYDEISSWLLAAQRLSTLISVSGEKARNDFIDIQREIIDTI